MSEYIRREDAVKRLDPYRRFEIIQDAIDYIESLEPADVVQVVRCRDCRYHVAINKCCHPDGLLCAKDNNFCSYGERKE